MGILNPNTAEMRVLFTHGKYELREIGVGDAPEIFKRLTSRLRVMKYLPIKVHTHVKETEKMIVKWLRYEENGIYVHVIQSKAEKRLVGIITAGRLDHSIAISIQIVPDRHSMGAACVLGPAIAHNLLAHSEIWRLWAYSDVDNVPTINMLHNMGCKCEGLMRRYEVHPNISDEPRDCLLWSITR